MARWAAALLILGILFYLLPVAPLRNALSRVPLTRFLAVLLIYLVALTGGIAKWHTVVNSAGAQTLRPTIMSLSGRWRARRS